LEDTVIIEPAAPVAVAPARSGVQVARTAAAGFVFTIVTNVFLFLGQIIIPRVLTREDYAEFTVSISFVALLAVLADLGLNPFFTRILAQADEERLRTSQDARGVILGSALVLRLVLSVCVAILVTTLASVFYGEPRVSYIAVLLITLLVSSRMLIVRSVGESVLRSIGKYSFVVFFGLIDAIAFFLLLFYGEHHSLTLNGVVWIYTLCNVPGFLLLLVMIARWLKQNDIALTVDIAEMRKMLITALPLSLGTIFFTIHYQADSLLLDKLSTAYEVSGYGATIRFLSAVAPLPLVLAAVVAPEITRLMTRGDHERSRRLTELSLRLLLTAAGAIAIVMTAASSDISTLLYGQKYLSATPLFMITGWMVAPIFLAWFTVEMCIAAGDYNAWTKYNGILMIGTIALDLTLIPSFGAIGAMSSKLLAIIIGSSWLLYSRRSSPYLNVAGTLKSLLRIGVSVAIAVALLFALSSVQLSHWFIAAGMMVVYAVLLHFTHAVRLSEILEMRRMFQSQSR
jgi:O-antigen/teichoic acid export membrane protein